MSRQSGARRNDIIDLMLDEIDSKDSLDKDKDTIDLELALISNAVAFFFAGFDTSSLTMATVVYGLIKHPEVQTRVRQEINDTIGDAENITAEHLKYLKYLENLINEALRFYGVTSHLQRICTKDYKVPDTEFTIIKGTPVHVEYSAIVKESFVHPDKFDPENFDAENNPNKFGFSGFGQGPRSCIGMRYAYMALKMGLVKILSKYSVVECEQTVDKLVFDLVKNEYKGGVKFRVEKL